MRNLQTIALSGIAFIIAVLAAASSMGAPEKRSLPNPTKKPAAGSERPADVSPYRSSVVGTDFDFITENDPTTFDRLEFIGFKKFEMPDKRATGEPLVQDAYVFDAHFTDGTRIGIAVDKDFGSRDAAEQDVVRYGVRLGKLPALYRRNIKHITVNFGGVDTTAFAEDKGHFFTIYSGNAMKRIGSHDLEETFFHEGTHASIQDRYLNSPEWKNAVLRDGSHITEYAKTSPQEDFAESALFAYTIIHHPERLPASDLQMIKATIPNRIAFFKRVYAEK